MGFQDPLSGTISKNYEFHHTCLSILRDRRLSLHHVLHEAKSRAPRLERADHRQRSSLDDKLKIRAVKRKYQDASGA